jgi:hypothetical protein
LDRVRKRVKPQPGATGKGFGCFPVATMKGVASI